MTIICPWILETSVYRSDPFHHLVARVMVYRKRLKSPTLRRREAIARISSIIAL